MPLITAPPDLSQTLTPPAARHPDRKIKPPLPRLQNPQFFSLSPFSRQEYRAYQTPGLILLPKLTSTSTHQPTKRQETPPSSLHSTHTHTSLPLPIQTNRRQHLQVSIRHTRQKPPVFPLFLYIYINNTFFLVARNRNNNSSPNWGPTTTPQLGGNNNNSPTGQGNHLQQGPYENDFYRRSRAHGHQHVLPGLRSHQHVLLLLPGWLHSALRGWATINTYYGGGLGLPR